MSIFLKIMPTFVGIVTFVITIRIMLKKGDSGYDKAVDKFLQDELEANNTKKDFNTLNITYVTPSKTLPFREYEDIPKYKNVIKKQKLVKRKVNLKMIKIPSNLTNTQLRKLYGVNNFEKISILEQHYNSYVRGLFEWGEELYNLNNIYDCKKVLLEATRLEANISQIYILLTNVYVKENDKSSLLNLKNTVENLDLSLKNKVLQEINKYL